MPFANKFRTILPSPIPASFVGSFKLPMKMTFIYSWTIIIKKQRMLGIPKLTYFLTRNESADTPLLSWQSNGWCRPLSSVEHWSWLASQWLCVWKDLSKLLQALTGLEVSPYVLKSWRVSASLTCDKGRPFNASSSSLLSSKVDSQSTEAKLGLFDLKFLLTLTFTRLVFSVLRGISLSLRFRIRFCC